MINYDKCFACGVSVCSGGCGMPVVDDFQVINGIDCVGVAGIGQNYEIAFDDEIRDFIATDIEATSWEGVLRQLKPLEGILQIVAC